MGIQIKGSNDTISADDGSIVLEGATLTFTNENITGISTMASAEVTGNLSIADRIVHTGDTNTAIRFSDTDTITAETAGDVRFKIESTGKTSVKTDESTTGLLVQNTVHDSQLQILATAANKNSVIWFGDAADDDIGIIDYDHNDNSLAVTVNTAEALRINSTAQILIGTTSDVAPDSFGSKLQIDSGNAAGSISIGRHTNSASAPALLFHKSRSGSNAGATIVNDDDTLGIINFYGADGVDRNSTAATIAAEVDGTPGSNDMPGRLVFKTTPDGAASVTERLRITNAGRVGVGQQAPVCLFDVAGAARLGGSVSNTDKHQDGCIIERNSTDGVVHITAGRSSGNLSGMNFYVAGDVGGSGANAKLRHLIDYQGNFKWYDSDGSTLRMHINTSGHVGIKTTGDLNGALLALGTGQGSNTTAGEHLKLAPTASTITFLDSNSNTSDTGDIQFWNTVYNNCSAKIELYHPASNTGAIKFWTHSGSGLVERMRIRNDGYVLMQASSSDMNETENTGFTYRVHSTSPYIRVKHTGNGSSYANHTLVHFIGDTSLIGEIKQDGDGTITYATSSDYRLKENVVDLTGAITRLKNLKPKRFNFKVNSGLTKDGFLAHELQEVVPESVNGTKDEVVTADSKVNNPVLEDREIGDPVYQTADASRVVPLLTAALQEAITKIETLETKVAALESA